MKSLRIPVADVMTRDLLIVQPSDHLDKVRDIFAVNNIHHIPVVDAQGMLAGILSKADFNRVSHVLTILDPVQYKEYNDALYRTTTAGDIMTRQVATVSPGDSLRIVAEIFRENLFHAVPVLDHGILVGLITTHDLITYCCTELSAIE
jgi:CBS domain-containing membrane protein